MGTVIAVGAVLALVAIAAVALWRAGAGAAADRARAENAELAREHADAELRREQEFHLQDERRRADGARLAQKARDAGAAGADRDRLAGLLRGDLGVLRRPAGDAAAPGEGGQAGPPGGAAA